VQRTQTRILRDWLLTINPLGRSGAAKSNLQDPGSASLNNLAYHQAKKLDKAAPEDCSH